MNAEINIIVLEQQLEDLYDQREDAVLRDDWDTVARTNSLIKKIENKVNSIKVGKANARYAG